MARSKGLEVQDPPMAEEGAALATPRIVRISKLEEGEAKGEGWVAIRSLLLVVGGMILVSYLIFSI